MQCDKLSPFFFPRWRRCTRRTYSYINIRHEMIARNVWKNTIESEVLWSSPLIQWILNVVLASFAALNDSLSHWRPSCSSTSSPAVSCYGSTLYFHFPLGFLLHMYFVSSSWINLSTASRFIIIFNATLILCNISISVCMFVWCVACFCFTRNRGWLHHPEFDREEPGSWIWPRRACIHKVVTQLHYDPLVLASSNLQQQRRMFTRRSFKTKVSLASAGFDGILQLNMYSQH